MKNINILSLAQAYSSLEKESYANFLNYYGITVRDHEIDSLTSLVGILSAQTTNKAIFNQFYVGYKIPQIGKEFDLLRFGNDYIINIELKKTSTEEKILKQLLRNKYYLSFTGQIIQNFTFVSDTEELFCLNNNDELKNADFSYLLKLLEEQQVDNITNIDNIFNPSNYLVSPFNSTERFIKGEYFLTKQQETVKSEVLNSIEDKTTAIFISITGSAGTGKTLLTYDITKELQLIGKKALIIHCGMLNLGQQALNDEHSWNIVPIKNYSNHNLSDFDVVIIDEAQRIYPEQLEDIVNKIQSNNGKCIFSYDKLQTLATWEEKRNIDDCINKIKLILTHKLTEKIRTNKEIALFMKAFFNCKSAIKLSSTENIELNYFANIVDAKDYLETLDNEEWEILRFTPSQYNGEHHQKYSEYSQKTSHEIIGQEFENIVITIDNFFSYDENGELKYRGNTYYDAAKMLFQNITRTRKRLNLVIINNSEVLDRCVSILQN